MEIDYSSLENAIKSLNKAFVRSQKDITDEEIRDAVIQRFEYTFELSCKFLRRKLEDLRDNPQEIDQMNYRDMIRTGAECGLIDSVINWFDYREKRNISSHTYDEKKAKLVYDVVQSFLKDVNFLMGKFKK